MMTASIMITDVLWSEDGDQYHDFMMIASVMITEVLWSDEGAQYYAGVSGTIITFIHAE